MITLYEMQENNPRSKFSSTRTAYFLRDNSTGHRSLTVDKVSYFSTEGNILLDDDTNSFKQWQASDNITLTPIAQIPTTYELLTDQYPELLL